MANPQSSGARCVAARILAAVQSEGRSLSDCAAAAIGELPAGEQALARELAWGTLRFAPRLARIAGRLLHTPLRRRDADIHGLLLIGLYQLDYMRVPEHAAVDLTVGAARQLRKAWAGGVLNAALRRYVRERESVHAALAADDEFRYAHPQWLLAQWRQAWPEDWQAIAAAGNEHPPLALRVNARRTSRARYLERLDAAGLAASAAQHAECGLVLAAPAPITALPGFAEGEVSVQDVAAQLAAGLLDLAPGQRLLDACAAPGGKTAHALECEPGLREVVAVDADGTRLARVRENLARLRLEATLIAGNALEPRLWWDGRGFDRILLDAPCTATGVIRRHPDIKALRRPEDVPAAAARQSAMLDALWPLLEPDGKLLYSTCSTLPAENADIVREFLGRTPDAEPGDRSWPWGRASGAGRQILPGEDGMDGFFYAQIRKTAGG